MKPEMIVEMTKFHSEREAILYGIGLGRAYWDGYYGSDEDILAMEEVSEYEAGNDRRDDQVLF